MELSTTQRYTNVHKYLYTKFADNVISIKIHNTVEPFVSKHSQLNALLEVNRFTFLVSESEADPNSCSVNSKQLSSKQMFEEFESNYANKRRKNWQFNSNTKKKMCSISLRSTTTAQCLQLENGRFAIQLTNDFYNRLMFMYMILNWCVGRMVRTQHTNGTIENSKFYITHSLSRSLVLTSIADLVLWVCVCGSMYSVCISIFNFLPLCIDVIIFHRHLWPRTEMNTISCT